MSLLEPKERLDVHPIVRKRPLWQWVPIALVIGDASLIYVAFVLAYWVRYSLKFGPHIQERIDFSAYLPLAALLLGIMLPVLFAKGAYRPHMNVEVVDEFVIIFSAATITVASIVVVTAMLQEYQYSRGVIIYLWLLSILLLSAGRMIARTVLGYCHRKGWGISRVLVVGATDAGKMAMQNMMSRPDLGFHLVGFVDHRPETIVRDFGRFRGLGTLEDVPGLVESHSMDEVIIALPAEAHEDVWPVLSLCEEQGIGVKLIPDLFELSLSRVQVDNIAGIPLLDIRERPLRRLARSAKRLLDMIIAFAVLVASLPLLFGLMLIIRIDSSGAALLTQERVGVNGHLFRCYKLRTMKHGADELRAAIQEMNEVDGPIFKIRNDPRCTGVGRWMRRMSLDELPQIWNVLKGDMSLVGPRPPLPSETAQYDAQGWRRLEVKPGMTGIWQVSGRSDLSFDEMLLMDLYYVDNWSLALDIRILARTVAAVLARHGAY